MPHGVTLFLAAYEQPQCLGHMVPRRATYAHVRTPDGTHSHGHPPGQACTGFYLTLVCSLWKSYQRTDMMLDFHSVQRCLSFFNLLLFWVWSGLERTGLERTSLETIDNYGHVVVNWISQWCSIKSAVQWCSIKSAVQWCSIKSAVQWCSIKSAVQWCSIKSAVQWCSIKSAVQWCSIKSAVQWCSIKSAVRAVGVNCSGARLCCNIPVPMRMARLCVQDARGFRVRVPMRESVYLSVCLSVCVYVIVCLCVSTRKGMRSYRWVW